jgi:integrase
MATIKFVYRSTKDKSFLTLRYFYNDNQKSKFIYIKTEIEVASEYWNNDFLIDYNSIKMPSDIRLINERKKQIEYQTEIRKQIDDLTIFVFKNIKGSSTINKKAIQDVVNAFYSKSNSELPTNRLIDYIDYYVSANIHDLTETGIKRCEVVKNKLKRFEIDNYAILIENVNDTFRNDFISFCKGQKYQLSTINRDLKYIKSYCTHASNKGLSVSKELINFSKPLKDSGLNVATKEMVYLNTNDLIKLKELTGLSPYLENARQWLIISCYAGQRISDFMRFKKSMIKQIDNRDTLCFTQIKTGKLIELPINKSITEILQLNNGDFPKPISDQKYNDYIKKVCEIAKINDVMVGSKVKNFGTQRNPIIRKEKKEYFKYELVSSHIGRRSFATNFIGKISTSKLKEYTGHKTEQMLLVYVGSVSSSKQDVDTLINE